MIIKFNRLSGVDDSGILEKVLGMQKEKLSALMDGETLDTELLKELTQDPEMQKNLGELSPDSRFHAR
ncbi:anti-RNA polymerase sigma factor SigE [Citrobacter braakii]|nr:anti-RNA polymerase sigma factor SigE [Citrobacter braakii]